jgi:hypothetical protein
VIRGRSHRLVFLVAILVSACGQNGGATSPTSAAEAYLGALGAHDAAALRRIAPPDFDSEQAVTEKIDKYARVDIGRLRREYVPHDVTPNIVTVRITADSPTFEDIIQVQRFGNAWYVLLGKLRGYTPGPTSQTRPPAP